MRGTGDMLKKGSICLTEFPFTDLKKTKIRPVVVLYHDIGYDDVIVMAISSVVARHKHEATILISKTDVRFKKTGLKRESVVLANRIVTLKRRRLFHRLGRLSQKYLDEIDEKVLGAFQIGVAIHDADRPRDVEAIQTNPTNETRSTNKTTFIPYARQSIDEKDVTAVCSVLRSDWLTTGPKVEEFEKAVAEYVGARYAVAVSSGTAALHAAMLALGIGPGDEVIVPPITFVATANCAVYCGARPVFADIDPRTYNIFVNDLERCITKKTRVIIPVHFAGQSCDMEAIQQIRKDAERKYGHKIYIIEDACHALGSLYKEKKVGSCTFSDMTVMSFHPVKHITTGEGGMVLTNDENLYKRLKRVRSHGITSDPEDFINRDLAFSIPQSPNPWYYEQQELGFNYRLTDIQCALGMSQLKKLDMFRKRRREIVNTYNQAFDNIKYVQTPFESSECDSNFHLYVLLIDFDKMGIDRPQFMLELKKEGIQTQVHYIPVHLQPYFRRTFGTKEGDCPNAEQYYQKCLSIPLYPAMSDFNVNDVIERLNGVLGRKQ